MAPEGNRPGTIRNEQVAPLAWWGDGFWASSARLFIQSAEKSAKKGLNVRLNLEVPGESNGHPQGFPVNGN